MSQAMKVAEDIFFLSVGSFTLIYLVFAVIAEILAVYGMATDHRFSRRRRYIYAFLILIIPFVEYFYLLERAHEHRNLFLQKLIQVKDKILKAVN